MKHSQGMKYVQAIAPAVVDGATATAIAVDTLGFEYLALIISLGVADAALTALKVQESDASGSGYTDIDDADFDVDSDLPTADEDGKLFGAFINLQNRKRYIKLLATAGDTGAGVAMSALGILSEAKIVPSDAASRGLAREVTVVS
jgi:hypothetical protein